MKEFRSILFVLLGAFLVAFGMQYFLVPSDIAAGGISGMAIIITSYIPNIPIGLVMMCIEVVLMIIGFIVIGPVFGGKTILCSFSISGTMIILEKFFPLEKPLSDDLMIQLLFGIMLTGIGMAIAFNENASTGGTDIIAKIINKYLKLNIGKCVLMVDVVVTLFAGTTFGIEKGMYAFLGVVINSFVIDSIIEGFNVSKKMLIISEESQKIQGFILNELKRSATVYKAVGAFTQDEKFVVSTIVDRKEFIKLRNFIKEIDSKAFITVEHVHEVLGEGFKEL